MSASVAAPIAITALDLLHVSKELRDRGTALPYGLQNTHANHQTNGSGYGHDCRTKCK